MKKITPQVKTLAAQLLEGVAEDSKVGLFVIRERASKGSRSASVALQYLTSGAESYDCTIEEFIQKVLERKEEENGKLSQG